MSGPLKTRFRVEKDNYEMELHRDATGLLAKPGGEKYWDRYTERWISKEEWRRKKRKKRWKRMKKAEAELEFNEDEDGV